MWASAISGLTPSLWPLGCRHARKREGACTPCFLGDPTFGVDAVSGRMKDQTTRIFIWPGLENISLLDFGEGAHSLSSLYQVCGTAGCYPDYPVLLAFWGCEAVHSCGSCKFRRYFLFVRPRSQFPSFKYLRSTGSPRILCIPNASFCGIVSKVAMVRSLFASLAGWSTLAIDRLDPAALRMTGNGTPVQSPEIRCFSSPLSAILGS